MDYLFERCTALTGGIATGKSTVAKRLNTLGAYIIDTDIIARQVVEPGMPALASIINEFGNGVINPDGTLNREYLRNEIIRHPEKRNRLNACTHPEINKEVIRLVQDYVSRGDNRQIIIDVPLLYEVGWYRLFKRVILVYVPVAIQIERLMMRDGLTKEVAEITLTAQMGIEEKRALAQFIINNSGKLEETYKQVDLLYNQLIN